MFPFATPDLSHRNRKDLARTAQLREFARQTRQTNPLPVAFDDLYNPPLNRDLWRRNVLGARSGSFPSPFSNAQFSSPLHPDLMSSSSSLRSPSPLSRPASRFEDLFAREQRLPPLRSGLPYRHRRRRSRSRSTSPSDITLAFTRAARALADALEKGTRYIANLEHEFQQDTGLLSIYANPRVLDYLWTAKLDWNGVPVREARENPDATASSETHFYGKYARRLMEALEDMRAFDPAVLARCYFHDESGRGELSAEDVETVMRKLQVSMGAIGKDLEALRGDRARLASLVRELKSASALIHEVGELWMPGSGRRRREARFREEERWSGTEC